jgi:hypothetical protein
MEYDAAPSTLIMSPVVSLRLVNEVAGLSNHRVGALARLGSFSSSIGVEKVADTPIIVLDVGTLALVILVSILKNERIKAEAWSIRFRFRSFKDKQ